MVAKPGVTRYGFKFAATYDACSQSTRGQPPKGSKYWSPLCLKDSHGVRDIAPPLPPGKYTAVFFSETKWHGPSVKAAELVVTRKK